ncbi:polysaccharide deacetylase family protein [Nitrospira sp. KM1]|uniref:polysaccharide deacetylase family protein n=1 Tax=Nitrospira sp. KM1 TaxID=1936990 RepID=UPI0015656438|nr:polysaccharide deacetylase family protein [Nitrospira sp. KM1]
MSLTDLKKVAWKAMAGGYKLSGMPRIRHRGTVVILTYHRVLTSQELAEQIVQPGMYVLDDVFEMHATYLKKHFHVLAFDELLERWQRGKWDHAQAYCVITFDDGWLDNYRNAAPILKRADLPATVFLPTDFIGSNRWFWPERLSFILRHADSDAVSPERRNRLYTKIAKTTGDPIHQWDERQNKAAGNVVGYDDVIERFKQIEYGLLESILAELTELIEIAVPENRVLINWQEVREMSAQNISFGSHSRSHRLLTLLTEKDIAREAIGSYEQLKDSGAAVTPVFCYPNGNYDAKAKHAVMNAGYRAAVSCDAGMETDIPSDIFALRRITMHQDICSTPALFSLALSGFR